MFHGLTVSKRKMVSRKGTGSGQRAEKPLCILVGGEHFSVPPSRLCSDLQRLLRDATTFHSDLTVRFRSARSDGDVHSGTVMVPVHRAIMGARSTYWLKRLNSTSGSGRGQGLSLQREEIFTLDEPGYVRSEAALRIVLVYLYTGGGKSMKDIDALCREDSVAVRDLLELSARWWGVNDKLHQSVLRLRSKTLMAGRQSVPSSNRDWYEVWAGGESGSDKASLSEYYQMEGPALPLGGVPFPDVRVRASVDKPPRGHADFGEAATDESFAPHRSTYDESSSGSDETDGSSGAADAKLLPSGGDLEAHRCLMSVRCSVFQGMLSQGMREESSGVVEISDVSSEGVEAMLRFLYSGSKPDASSASAEGTGVGRGFLIDPASATDAYVLGKRYMLSRLRELAGTSIMDLFDLEDVESVLGLWTWSQSIQDGRLSIASCWFLRVGFSEDELARATRELGMGEEQVRAIEQATGMSLRSTCFGGGGT